MRRDLGALVDREHDLLIIGGGIYGAAAAWDAAQRGLSVALAEKGDFGAATSWNSLKTIHGGLRHLQRADLKSLRESARERAALLRIAPRLVRPLDFLVPTYGHGPRGREAMTLALKLNDLLTHDRNEDLAPEQHIPDSRMLSEAEVRERVPGLPASGLTGGALWTDAQAVSTERLLLAFLHAAADEGALAANHLEVTNLLRTAGRVTGAEARDGASGETLAIRARMVLNAAGPGAADVLRRAGLPAPRVPLLRAMNLVLGQQALPDVALGGGTDGRYLFLVPWRGYSIVGTDYVPSGAPTGRETDTFLAEASRAYPWAGWTKASVTRVHQGLVPGEGGAWGLWTRPLLIDHQTADGTVGLISMIGVKYTTTRAVAEQAIDIALRRLGRGAVACRTAVTPLAAAAPLSGPLEDQTRHAVREEMAVHLDDAVLRRLDLGSAGPPPAADLERVARTMAEELGWDEARRCEEKSRL